MCSRDFGLWDFNLFFNVFWAPRRDRRVGIPADRRQGVCNTFVHPRIVISSTSYRAGRAFRSNGFLPVQAKSHNRFNPWRDARTVTAVEIVAATTAETLFVIVFRPFGAFCDTLNRRLPSFDPCRGQVEDEPEPFYRALTPAGVRWNPNPDHSTEL